VDKYARFLDGKQIGIHCHNNQQLAFANTIEAIIRGANRLDATLYGIGRGAGNCPLELLMSFLKNPKFRIQPILETISDLMIPLRDKIEWGYLIPYMITGTLDEHPRSAMKILASPERNHFRSFYEQLLDDQLA
jgi:4-hydroxy 2-oxovalerate aldolase